MKISCTLLVALAAILLQTSASQAVTYVSPKIGGAQVMHNMAPMIMPEMYFDGNDMLVLNASRQPWPMWDWDDPTIPNLRPLSDPNFQWTPGAAYEILADKPYNFQYGWDSGLLDEVTYPFPVGSVVWVKVLSQTPGLETYYKDGASDTWYNRAYAPLFGTPEPNGTPSPDKWRWNKSMRHNTYAVPKTYYGRIYATYEVYIGEVNGVPSIDPRFDEPFGSSIVTLHWLRPCPYVVIGDLSLDCRVDFNDMAILADQWGSETCLTPGWCDKADVNRSGTVEFADLGEVTASWLTDCFATPSDPLCVPR